MCDPVSLAVGAGLMTGAIGAEASQAHKAAKAQEHIADRAAKAQKALLDQYKEANRPTASKMTSGFLSLRDKQRLLARSMGGTLLTDPMASMPTMGKKTLLGA